MTPALVPPSVTASLRPSQAAPEPTLVLWNPASGRAAEAAELRQQLAGLRGLRLVDTQSAAHTCELAATAVDQGFTHVIAAGGDGTVNATINGLMPQPQRPSFAVLPVGTANDFAQTLAIPDEPLAAAELALYGARRAIDVVEYEVAGQPRWFANVAAGGNSDEVTRQLTDEVKRRWGPLCYLRGALGVLADLKGFDTTVTLDDGSVESHSVWNVIVANGRTNAGHLQLAPRANPEDGLLDLILIREGDLLDVPSLVVQYAVSDYLKSDLVRYRQARSVRFQANPMMRFSIDGEAIEQQPAMFSAVPGALQMAIGPNYVATPPETA